MKVGWEIRKLGEIADVEYGFTDKSFDEGDYRYVRITDIDGNGELISTEKKYLKYSKEAERFLIVNNDLLMARTGATFAKVLLYEDFEPSVFASYLIKIKFKIRIENKLYWYFTKTKSYWEQANSLASGAAQPHFNGTAVKQVVFSYPHSISEQQHIVAILDEAFAAIDIAKANAEKNLKNAKELFESYLQGVFENKGDGWEEKNLTEVCDLKSGNTISPSLERIIGDVLYVKVGDMNLPSNEVEINTSSRFVNKKDIKVNQIIPEGAVIFPKRGGAIATNKKRIIKKPTIVDLNTMAIIPSKKIGSDYFFHWFKLFDLNSISNGANIPQINNYSFDNVLIPFPKSIDEQQAIVLKLDALSSETKRLESNYQQKLTDLEELKKSILQKAFNGELNTKEICA